MMGRSLCELLVLVLTVSSCESSSYGNILTSLPTLINNVRHSRDSGVGSARLLNDLGSQLNFHTMMTAFSSVHTRDQVSNCERDLNYTLHALFNKTDWAIQMIDAMGKPGSGFLLGNLYWIGNYDECVNTTAIVTGKMGSKETFKGKYCKAGFQLVPRMPIGIAFGPDEIPLGDLNFGICVPDSCSPTDVQNLINGVLKNVSIKAEVVKCQEEDLPLDYRAIIVIVIFSLLGAIILAGTAYDILVIQKQHVERDTTPDGDDDEKKHLVPDETPNEDGDSRNIRHRGYGTGEVTQPEVNETNIQEPRRPGTSMGVCGRLLLAFSLYTNGAKILSTHSTPGTIGVLNGIRFISLTWVMLGHTYAFSAGISSNIAMFMSDAINSFSFMAIWNATVAVDTFFILSGLLVALLTLREMNRVGSFRNINWPMFYIHRFWRLTPPYMLVIMLYVPLFQYWYNGPFWPQDGVERNHCNNWWKNLLYINNFWPNKETCMLWSWYLANDMQFYIISPLLMIPLYISGLLGGVLCLLVLVTSWTVTGVLTSVNGYPMGLMDNGGRDMGKMGDYFDNLYVRPYARIGPYIVGMLTGYILHKTSCNVKISRSVNVIGWIVAAGCCLSVVYGNFDSVSGKHYSGKHMAALYNSLHSSVWALGVCWVIFACATGYGGIVNTFLSWRVFIPLSRLTYLAYLIHPVVMLVHSMGLRQPLYINHLHMAFLFLGYVVMSYGAAFVLSLVFESPFMGIEKALHKKQK